MRMCQSLGMVVLLLIAGMSATPVRAGADSLCYDAASAAAEATGVPVEVLVAIAQTETGRQSGDTVRPWPWTVNVAGSGAWFDTRAEAAAHAAAALSAGQTSFDLGCFQLNHRWHGEAFSGIDAMLDPDANALHAARFLARLFAETGDWSLAAGAYHSRTPELARRYRDRFDRFLAAAPTGDAAAAGRLVQIADDPRPNGFPLMQQRDGVRSPGSLVPLDSEG